MDTTTEMLLKGLDRIEALLVTLNGDQLIPPGEVEHVVNNARQIVSSMKTVVEMEQAERDPMGRLALAVARNTPPVDPLAGVKYLKSALDLVQKAITPKLSVELVRYRCRKCGDEVKNADLRETDGLLEHPSEGEYDGATWHQLWCGPVEELPTQREIHRLDEQASEGQAEAAENAR